MIVNIILDTLLNKSLNLLYMFLMMTILQAHIIKFLYIFITGNENIFQTFFNNIIVTKSKTSLIVNRK